MKTRGTNEISSAAEYNWRTAELWTVTIHAAREATDALILLSWKMKIVLYASLSVSIYLYFATMIMMERNTELEI